MKSWGGSLQKDLNQLATWSRKAVDIMDSAEKQLDYKTEGIKRYVVFQCEKTGKWIKINHEGKVEFSMKDLREAATFFWDQIEKHSPESFSAKAAEKFEALTNTYAYEINQRDKLLKIVQEELDYNKETVRELRATLLTKEDALDAANRECEKYASETSNLQQSNFELTQKLRHLEAKYRDAIEYVDAAKQALAQIPGG